MNLYGNIDLLDWDKSGVVRGVWLDGYINQNKKKKLCIFKKTTNASLFPYRVQFFCALYQHKSHGIPQSEICATKLTENLTLCRPMDFSIKLKTEKSGWSIVFFEGSRL